MQRTPDQIKALPKFSRIKRPKVYKLTDTLYIDDVSGVGVTKTHAEIKQRGMLVPMSPQLYKKLSGADTIDDSEASKKMGLGFGVASPRLYLNVDSFMAQTQERATIVDADGVGTCQALAKFGVLELHVHVLLLGYSVKNIEDKSDFLNWLSKGVAGVDGKLANLPTPFF